MSSILKALRRVEEEHPGQPQRRPMRGDIVSATGGKPPALRRGKTRGPNPVIWSSLGAALLLAVLVWWRLPGKEDTDLVEALPPSGAKHEATPAAAPAARPQAPEPSAPPPVEQLAAATEPEAVAPPPALAAPEAAPAIDPNLPTELAVRLPPLGETLDAPVPAPPVAVAPPAPPGEPAPVPAARVTRSEPQPPRQPVAAKRVLAPSPPSAPTVQVERTSWHPKPERRVAWLRVEGSAAMREVHEGDALGTLVVKEIRPSAVVFLHGTDELQRRVGEH